MGRSSSKSPAWCSSGKPFAMSVNWLPDAIGTARGLPLPAGSMRVDDLQGEFAVVPGSLALPPAFSLLVLAFGPSRLGRQEQRAQDHRVEVGVRVGVPRTASRLAVTSNGYSPSFCRPSTAPARSRCRKSLPRLDEQTRPTSSMKGSRATCSTRSGAPTASHGPSAGYP